MSKGVLMILEDDLENFDLWVRDGIATLEQLLLNYWLFAEYERAVHGGDDEG